MIEAVMSYGCVCVCFFFFFLALHTSVRARNRSLLLAAFLPLDALASGQHHQKRVVLWHDNERAWPLGWPLLYLYYPFPWLDTAKSLFPA